MATRRSTRIGSRTQGRRSGRGSDPQEYQTAGSSVKPRRSLFFGGWDNAQVRRSRLNGILAGVVASLLLLAGQELAAVFQSIFDVVIGKGSDLLPNAKLGIGEAFESIGKLPYRLRCSTQALDRTIVG